jgi:hypothetical protein
MMRLFRMLPRIALYNERDIFTTNKFEPSHSGDVHNRPHSRGTG